MKAAGSETFVRAASTALIAAGVVVVLGGCVAAAVGGAVVGGAMVATDRRTSGAQVEDELIEVKSGNRMNESLSENARVNTTSYNRMVLLTGDVPSDAEKTTAEQAVARVDNVQSVVNELTVGPPTSLAQRTRDAFVSSKVKASLVDAKDLFANSIKVVTHRGVVYLMGRLTDREADRASEVARGVSGVVKVVRVFEIVSEAELAKTAPKSVAKPASAS